MSAPEPTEEFGPYVVYERLGLGGMATVHRAKKMGIAGYERSVALKRMLSHLAEDQQFVESFVREAKVASLLVHPNVAQVYDFGRIHGVYYIAMELVSGFDMRKLLRHANRTGEPIPLAVLLQILVELCDALEYAHTFVDEQGAALGIVHRDISPSNLILAHTGHLKVIDFGIAKAQSRALHTESGQVKGKLGYMSPEVALGLPIGPASDVFSAGVVAWELITASPLFSAKSDFETMRRIREAEIVPPSRWNPACPPQLDAVVLAALERDVERRLPSAAAFRGYLADIAARAHLQLSARAVAEWMQQVPSSDPNARRPSMTASPPPGSAQRMPLPLPPEPLTASLHPNGRPTLVRTREEAQLATEIWGDDAHTSMSPGPDFSATTPPPVQAYEPAYAQRNVSPTVQYAHAPGPTPLPVPQPLPLQQPPPPAPPRRRPLVVLLSVAIVATVGAAIGIVWPRAPGSAPPVAAGSGSAALVAATTPDAGSATTGAAVPPPPAPAPPPVPVDAAVQAVTTPRPPPPPPPHVKHDHPGQHVGTHEPEPHHPDPIPEPEPAHPEPPTPPVVPPVIEPHPIPPPPPPPVVPPKPTRTPIVAATAVTKVAGELPQLQLHDNAGSVDLSAKLCLDEAGRVSSVKLLQAPAEAAADLQRALTGWRYKPYVKDGVPAAVCFVLSLHVVVKPT